MGAGWLLWGALLMWCGTKDAVRAEYCLAKDETPYLYYAAKTSYQFVYSQRAQPYTVPNCRPTQLWLLARHGVRHPHKNQLVKFSTMNKLRDQIIANHEQRKNGELCFEDLEGLRGWKLNYTVEDILAPQGYTDLVFLAKRLKTNLPQILDATYTPDRFILKYANSQRTEQSLKAMAEGFFGQGEVDITPSMEDNVLLMPEKNCSFWDKSFAERDTSEEMAFRKGPQLKEMLGRVSKRLGFLYNITFDVVYDIYGLCRFDKATNYMVTSPWCAAFTKEDLQLLEYSEDLTYYYSSGYGSSVIAKMGCPLFRDLLDNFDKVARNESDLPSGLIYSVHSLILRSVLTRLGIGKDPKPPTHSNYGEMSRRHWRTSFLTPFSGNLAAVFYKCWTGEENRIMFFMNEEVYPYEGCEVGLCSWNYIKKKFKDVINPSTCNYKFCNPGSSASSLLPFKLVLIASIILSHLAVNF